MLSSADPFWGTTAVIAASTAHQNSILCALTRQELSALLPALELKNLPRSAHLQERGEIARHAFFPVSGVASMVTSSTGGEQVEVATIGYEGVVGLDLYLGAPSSAVEVFIQVPGEILRMDADTFRQSAEEPSLRRILNRYTQALITQIAQTSACNRLHRIEARCARWLLQTHDRVRGAEFSLTHEFLGQMIGVRRPTVTEVANHLQDAGLIHYKRGIVTVLDRPGLERAACDCYGIVTKEYEKLLGAGHKKASASTART
jgi:CRP-like cAMP-binding protein